MVKITYADVAELADALDLGSSAFGVGVNSRGAYIMLVPNSIKSELKEFNGKIDNIYVVGGANSVSDKEA
ncbi:cell wall-binding repeat-containing protein, partial [Clostridioides mangenotii]|uniref:cell wall-binding repeat-containing protein n=1 Tax=Metaclostridioides mangenotii TaxID=1540 RepID=UPI00214A02CD